MSDVEKICEQNYNRVKWANEYVDVPEEPVFVPSRREQDKAWAKLKSMRTATTVCSAACGAGATFAAIGITCMSPEAIIIGAIAVLVFLVSGYAAETAADRAMEEVMAYE